MSGFVCPQCQETVDIFGRGGGERLAADMALPFLGSIPLDPRVRESGDLGRPFTMALPNSPAGEAFRAVAAKVVEAVQPVRT
jgi:MinD-like ATPase involved in chromosome partitioning or flagellar assembly